MSGRTILSSILSALRPIVSRFVRGLVGYQRGVNRRLSLRRLLGQIFRRIR